MHPVQIVYDSLTRIVAPAMSKPVETQASCSYCGRDAQSFNNQAYEGKDGYKQPLSCCPACESFAIGDINILGIESIRGKGNKVSNKFGMMPGVSAAIEVSTGRAVFLPPKGVYDKLPATFLEQIETHVMPRGARIPWVVEHVEFPLIYIADFGKSTGQLIKNLAISASPDELLAITDKSVERINATASLNVHRHLQGLPKKEVYLFMTTVRGLALGTTSPRAANQVWAESPDLANAARALPVDPHQRLALLNFIRNLEA